MRVEDFPRPKHDNRRGVHWSASVFHPTGAALDFWIDELQAMNIKWLKLMDDGGGSALGLCRRLLAADIMPVVRLYRLEPNPGHIGSREEETLRRLIDAGVRYFETNNEPDVAAEWQGGRMPANWADVAVDHFIYDADRVIGMGGLPALPALAGNRTLNLPALVAARGRADLFTRGAWIAVHNYTLNHPLDYPYDSVNQDGAPISQEDYDQLGPWAWEGRPRDQLNEWRRADKKPGQDLDEDAFCFLAFRQIDALAMQALGHSVPIISTEGGPVIGWKDDRRYPRVDPHTHAEWTVAINDFMQGGREIHGLRCPENYFAMCHWFLGNYRLGFMAPGWESHSWYTDWWNSEFGLSGELPVVAAVKAMPNTPVDQVYQAVVTGRVVRVDNDLPLPDLDVRLLAAPATGGAGDREVGRAVTAADGAFRIERLVADTYDLAIAPWGIVRRGVSAAADPLPVAIRLVGGDSSVLSGDVLNASGAPLAGVRVALQRDGATVAEATSDADGAFRFADLSGGIYGLAVSGITVTGIALDGWQAKRLKLAAGAGVRYRYAVQRSRLLSAEESAGRRAFFGIVTDAAGQPLNGIKLKMAWGSGAADCATATTGADPYQPAGRYEFLHTPGVYQLSVIQDDWPSDLADDLDTATVPGREGEAVAYEVNFRLQPVDSPAQVDGVISGGQPGRELRLLGAADGSTATLAADGSFVFPDLRPGSYRLELAGVGPIADEISLAPGALHKVFFPMRSRLAGQVLAPPEDLTVVLYAPRPWSWTRQSALDGEGRFAFDGLPAGRYRIEVGGQALGDLLLTGENTLQLATIDLAQGRRSVVRGRVADGSGRPQADTLMILRRANLLVAQAHTAADGSYRFGNLIGGAYTLEAAGMGVVASGIVLDGRREYVADVLWAGLGPRSALQGRVLAASGAPAPDTLVRLLQDDEEVARTRSDSGGAFRFIGLAGGVYALAAGESAPLAADIVLDEDATITRDLTLPAGAGKLLDHYVLFGPTTASGSAPAVSARIALALATEWLLRTGGSGGFNVTEAIHAAHVVIVGDTTPASVELTLRGAGCQVTRLSGDDYALAAALEQLLRGSKEG